MNTLTWFHYHHDKYIWGGNYKARLFPLINLFPLSFSLSLLIFLLSFSPYLPKTLIPLLVVQNKITPISPTHLPTAISNVPFLFSHWERTTKCQRNADRTWLWRGFHVTYFRAFSRTIDLSGADERRGWVEEEAAKYWCTIPCLSIFQLSSDAGP